MAKLRMVALLAGAGGAVAYVVKRKVGGDDQAGQSAHDQRRYAAPAEAGSQPPKAPGEAPSSAAPAPAGSPPAAPTGEDAAVDMQPIESATAPDAAVMPDTSPSDPVVREQEAAAAADAGSIGGSTAEVTGEEPGAAEDPATRPVLEGSGDAEETFEAADLERGGNREIQP